jgi:GNAT superfamily N-acetyltransferase
MFTDMGLAIQIEALDRAFRTWLADMLPAGIYRAWVAQTDSAEIVGGGGITVLPWPPGPPSLTSRLAFVYNVYTEPEHRSRGLARRVMHAIHAWCRENGIGVVALNASGAAQPLYESMGYAVTGSPMMVLALGPAPQR